MDLQNHKLHELKDILKEKGLSTAGTKSDLINRLVENQEENNGNNVSPNYIQQLESWRSSKTHTQPVIQKEHDPKETDVDDEAVEITPEKKRGNDGDGGSNKKKKSNTQEKCAVVYGPNYTKFYKNARKAEEAAALDDKLEIKIFDTKQAASKFALENKKKRAAKDTAEETASVAVAATKTKTMTLAQMKEMMSKKLSEKNGSKIMIYYKMYPGKNLIVIVIDIGRDFDDDGTKTTLVSHFALLNQTQRNL